MSRNYRFVFFIVCISVVLFACKGKKAATVAKPQQKEQHKQSYYEKKYGVKLNRSSNIKLYAAIDKWHGVPHKLGGCAKSGVDCSCLVNALCKEAYSCNTPRTTKDLYEHCKKIKKSDLKEGDIVFFNMKGKKVDHVGLYLSDNKFVHTSVKKGVMVSSLDEAHFAKAYKSAGRLKCL